MFEIGDRVRFTGFVTELLSDFSIEVGTLGTVTANDYGRLYDVTWDDGESFPVYADEMEKL